MASLSNAEKLTLISNLGTMLSAGIPILEAVDSLLAESKGQTQKVFKVLKEDLNQGKTIAESLEKSNSFDRVVISLIKAAEQAGTLDQTLKDLTEKIKQDIEFTDKVKAALYYPVFVVMVFILVFMMILVFVVPRVGTVFSRLRVELPLPTKILIALSNFILSYTLIFALSTLLFITMAVLIYKFKRRFLLNILFSLPLVSTLARQIDLVRFSRSMSLLLSSGIPIVDSLELAKEVVSKKEIYLVVLKSKSIVSSGKKFSEGLRSGKGVIPGMMVRVVEAGEKSGTLEKSMQEASEYFEYQVNNSLKRLTTLLEPILLVLVGIMVGGIMLSIIAPIYGLIGQIQGR